MPNEQEQTVKPAQIARPAWHARFERHFLREGAEQCWLWRSALSQLGYGRFALGGKARIASRLAYEIAYGPPAPGRHILHRCDTPACVNPAHLYEGDHAQNMRDKSERGRVRGGGHGPKLSLHDRDKVRALARAGKFPLTVIGKKFGIAPSSVRSLRNARRPTP